MAADDPLRTAVQRYCTSIARDRLLVQAAGGNISWKSGNTLWIKASGTWLADAEQKEIFVPVDRQPIDAALARGDYAVNPCALEGYALRPSIETLLHALMPQRIVVHLHPVDVVAHLVRSEPEYDLRKKLDPVFSWALIPYHKPGASLARVVHQVLTEGHTIDVLLLQNHGIILGGAKISDIEQRLQHLIDLLRIDYPERSRPTPRLPETVAAPQGYRISASHSGNALEDIPDWPRRLREDWAICPDQVVFLGAQACCQAPAEELAPQLADDNYSPPYIFLHDGKILERVDVTLAQRAQLDFYLDVIRRQSADQKINPLKPEQVADLLNWEAEIYRMTINK